MLLLQLPWHVVIVMVDAHPYCNYNEKMDGKYANLVSVPIYVTGTYC